VCATVELLRSPWQGTAAARKQPDGHADGDAVLCEIVGDADLAAAPEGQAAPRREWRCVRRHCAGRHECHRSGLADYQESGSARRSSRRSQRESFSHGLLVGELIGLWILLAQAIPNLTASDANARASRSCITSNLS